MFFGSKSTTASNDYQRALDLAKRIVSYGMSPLGVVDRDTAPRSPGQSHQGNTGPLS